MRRELKIVKILLDFLCGKGEPGLTKGMEKDCLAVLKLGTMIFYWHISSWFCDFSPVVVSCLCVWDKNENRWIVENTKAVTRLSVLARGRCSDAPWGPG